MLHDIRYAIRGVSREPLLSAFIVATLALDVGANVAMLRIADRLLLRRPAHVVHPEQLVRFYQQYPTSSGQQTSIWVGFTTFENLRDATMDLADIAAMRVRDAAIGRGRDTRMASTAWVSANFFGLVGVRPQLGRFFREQENRGEATDYVAIVSNELWRTEFGGDSSVVGRSLVVEGTPYVIVGVAPPGFTGVQLERIDVWLPLHTRGMCRPPVVTTGCTTVNWNLIGRRKPGASLARLSDDATSIHRRTYAGSRQSIAQARMIAAPIWYNDTGEEPGEAAVARWLVGVSGVVLIIACANVIILLMARGMRRRRELAVRIALGAGRSRLIRLLLCESVLLAMMAGVASIVVGWVTKRLIEGVLLSNVAWTGSTIDIRLLGLTGVLALGAGLVVGVVPALQTKQRGLALALKAGMGEDNAPRSWMRAGIMVAQATLSVILLVGAGLFVRSLWRLEAIDLGLEPDRVVTATVRVREEVPAAHRYDRAMAALDRERPIYVRALDKVRELDGVEAASLTVGLPFVSNFSVSLGVPGYDSLPRSSSGSGGHGPFVSAVTRDYFATVGTPLLRGRDFNDADGAGSELVTIVSASMARALWPGRDAVGQCLVIGDHRPTCSRVVGIVADVHRTGFREDRSWQYYVPFGQERELGIGGFILTVRPRRGLRDLWAPLRDALYDVDPSVEYAELRTLEEALASEIRPWRLGATVFSVSGALALLVGAVGLYSVMSYLVARRTHELGVRVALGASRVAIASLILRTGSALAGAGLLIGLAAVFALGRFVEPLLFETSSSDMVVLAVTAGTIILTALLAGVLPTRRALKVNPMTALRAE